MPARPTDTTLPSHEGSSTSGAGAAPVWSLTIVHAPDRALVSRRFDLGTRTCIGRAAAEGVDVAIDDGKASREHATITRAGAAASATAGVAFELRDLGSRNGTFVNGARVAERALQPGDIVRIGDTLLELADTAPRAASDDPTLVGTAPAFLAAVDLADRVASSELPVLILGETGTGKDVLAQHLHRRSGRRGPLVAVNCAALADDLIEATLFGHKKGAFTGATADSPGMFLEAQGGTLFLDEIGELDLAHQAKLLRALDAREIIPVGGTRSVHTDARVIAATNSEPVARIADGSFRTDLYARLAGTIIRMPPLRARRGDILALAERFLAEASPTVERRLSGLAAERLVLHAWPRNVRELLAVMRRLALQLGDRTEARGSDVDAVLDAPVAASAPAATGERPGMPTREELVAQLTEHRGNVSRVAALHQKDVKQIYRWLKRYQLDANAYR